MEVPGQGDGADVNELTKLRELHARWPKAEAEAAQAHRPTRLAGVVTQAARRRMDDVTTFAQAAEKHLDDVYGYLVWFTGDRFLAEDLAGETFERALRLWHRFDPERGSARTWLCQVARTVALDHFRSEKRRQRREQLAAVPERFEERLVEGLSPELEAALAAADRRRARGDRAPRRARLRRRAPRPRCSESPPPTARRA